MDTYLTHTDSIQIINNEPVLIREKHFPEGKYAEALKSIGVVDVPNPGYEFDPTRFEQALRAVNKIHDMRIRDSFTKKFQIMLDHVQEEYNLTAIDLANIFNTRCPRHINHIIDSFNRDSLYFPGLGSALTAHKGTKKYVISHKFERKIGNQIRNLQGQFYGLTYKVWCHSDPHTWGEIAQLYVAFLQSKIPFTPIHQGSIYGDVRDAGVLPLLILINKLGFVTVNSQPGVATTGKSFITGEKYIEIQREYIEGLFLIKYSRKLFDRLVEILGSNAAIIVSNSKNKLIMKHAPDAMINDIDFRQAVGFVDIHQCDDGKACEDYGVDNNKDRIPVTSSAVFNNTTKKYEQWKTFTSCPIQGSQFMSATDDFCKKSVYKKYDSGTYSFAIISAHFCQEGRIALCLLNALMDSSQTSFVPQFSNLFEIERYEVTKINFFVMKI